MDSTDLLERQFARIGARAKFAASRDGKSSVTLDIGRDASGEFFDITWDDSAAELRVLQVQPQLRHLLLLSEQSDGKHKYLCGFEERHWFVAAIPERASVSTIQTAFEALKPWAVRFEERRLRLPMRERNRRRNAAFVRQGEWFFVPVRQLPVGRTTILRNEPLRRGQGKPHMCEELVRTGGELVYVSPRHFNGVNEWEYRALISDPKMRDLRWEVRGRNMRAYVRGRVRHSDHKTIVLNGWHQVFMNTENLSIAMQHVAFID